MGYRGCRNATRTTGTQLTTETRIAYDNSTWHALNKEDTCLLGGVCVPCLNRVPAGVIVGDSGLCCCVAVVRVTSIVIRSHKRDLQSLGPIRAADK